MAPPEGNDDVSVIPPNKAITKGKEAETMDDNPFNTTFSSPRPTLREEGTIRASSGPPQTPKQQPQNQRQYHPLAFSTPAHHGDPSVATTSVTTGETPESLAQSARKEWRDHGSGITQSLEEKRRLDEDRPGTITCRVLSAETRYDVANKKYTTYILRVQLANNQILQLEHRYSEFAKLNEQFKSHNVAMQGVVFPSKHWAGRMGNWTPSLSWAPEKHDQLILYRKIQLDIWLVHVVEKYNLGDLPHSLAKVVYDFLTLPDRPPCEQENQPATPTANTTSSMTEEWTKWNNPLSFTLGSTIRQATSTLEHMCHLRHHNHQQSDNSTISQLNDTDQSIPLDLLKCAKGLCFLTVIKAGLVVSGRIGTGLIICKLDDDGDGGDIADHSQRWSAPCALGTVGMGWGMLAGGDITHYLVVLTTQDAVESMLAGTVQLGAELGVAVGPTGRSANTNVAASNHSWTVHPAYSYAHSQGLFVGMSLEGSILTTRNDVNAKFYGRPNISPAEILNLPPPKAAQPLYQALAKAMNTTIPEGSYFRPSQLFQSQPNHNGQQQSITTTNTGIPPPTGVIVQTGVSGDSTTSGDPIAAIEESTGRLTITESEVTSPSYISSPASSWTM